MRIRIASMFIVLLGIPLQAQTLLSGTVTGGGDASLDGANISVGDEQRFGTWADREGKFLLNDLRPGPLHAPRLLEGCAARDGHPRLPALSGRRAAGRGHTAARDATASSHATTCSDTTARSPATRDHERLQRRARDARGALPAAPDPAAATSANFAIEGSADALLASLRHRR